VDSTKSLFKENVKPVLKFIKKYKNKIDNLHAPYVFSFFVCGGGVGTGV
jgi:hypothetical protein